MYLFLYCVYIVCLSMIYTCSSQKGVMDPGSGFKLPSVGAQNPTRVLGRAANVLNCEVISPACIVCSFAPQYNLHRDERLVC